MPSREPLLEPGERVVFRTGLHPASLSGAVSLAVFAAVVAALLIAHNDLARATEWQIIGVAAVVAVLGFVRPLLRLARTHFVVTERRLLVSWGLLRPRVAAAGVAPDVMAAERTRRWVDAGTVAVDLGGDVHTWTPVARPEALAAAVREQARRAGRPRDRKSGG
jgi:hypothetical protein